MEPEPRRVLRRSHHGRSFIFKRNLAVGLRMDVRPARLETRPLVTASKGMERVLLGAVSEAKA